MPTASEKAVSERDNWADLASRWSRNQSATELNVVIFYDPAEDLSRRASRWGHRLPDHTLASISSFAAGLASAEADAWENGPADIATRAYEDRRFLLADRIIHWAVPWLFSVGGVEDADFLLDLGDEMRVAPKLSDDEGMRPAGEDSFGPTDLSDDRWRESLWSGALIPTTDPNPSTAYMHAAEKWSRLAHDHPGSASLWLDLARRAGKSSAKTANLR